MANARSGRCGLSQKGVEHELDAEVIHRTAEEYGRLFAVEHAIVIVILPRAFEHFEFLTDSGINIGSEFFGDDRVVDSGNGNRGAIGAVRRFLEEMDFLFLSIVNTFELDAFAQGPVDRKRADAENAFEFIEKFQRWTRRAIQLVHKGENRHAAPTAHFEKFPGLRLNAFACVDHHHDRIDGGEHAVGVFGKVFVTRRIEQIDSITAIFKLQNSRTNTNAAFAFQFHPVGGGRALVFTRSN